MEALVDLGDKNAECNEYKQKVETLRAVNESLLEENR